MNHPLSTLAVAMQNAGLVASPTVIEAEIVHDRVIRNGMVAVLYSPGYGAGWSTWNTEAGNRCLFCPEIVNLILAGNGAYDNEELERIVAEQFGESFYLGSQELRIEWLSEGTKFRIHEYDGSESVEPFDPGTFYTA